MTYTPRQNWVLFGLFVLGSIGIMIAALISPQVRAAAYAPLRELLVPPPKPIVLSVLYSTEKTAWLTDVGARFEQSDARVDGRPIQLDMKALGSREIYLSVMDGSEKPVIISPASSLQISILQDLSTTKFGKPLTTLNDQASCRSMVKTPLVLVAWKERADVLLAQTTSTDIWQAIYGAVTNPQGWAAYNHADWGYVKFGQTNPLKSNSGFQTILLMTYDFHHKTSGLTTADILSDADFQKWFTSFEGTISEFGESTGTYMQDMIAYGPSRYDIVAVYESTAIEQAANAVGRYGEIHVYYPPATHISDHPFCVLDAEWVTPEQRQAAQLFMNYLAGHEAQQLALMSYGFRPTDPSVALDQAGSPFQRYTANGIMVNLPAEVELPSGNVLSTLLDFWTRNIQR